MADLELLAQTTSRRRKKGFKAESGSVQTIVNCTQRAGRKEGCWTGFAALERARVLLAGHLTEISLQQAFPCNPV